MDCIVIGGGSAGFRHARSLTRLGYEVLVVSRRENSEFKGVSSIEEVHRADYIVTANETAKHDETTRLVVETYPSARHLIEKPLAVAHETYQRLDPLVTFVAFQLRFSELVHITQDALADIGQILSFQFYVGQHLSTWRPGRETRDQYSAHRRLGGGVLRDLSHEIDLALWMLGDLRIIGSVIRRTGTVTIDSEDQVLLLLESGEGAVGSVNLNYLDHSSHREFRIVGSKGTIRTDLLSGYVNVCGRTYERKQSREKMTDSMHAAAIAGESRYLCDVAQAHKVDRFILKAEFEGSLTQ